jgi:hypothetical protein
LSTVLVLVSTGTTSLAWGTAPPGGGPAGPAGAGLLGQADEDVGELDGAELGEAPVEPPEHAATASAVTTVSAPRDSLADRMRDSW